MSANREILPAGQIRRFEPTQKGRDNAAAFHARFPTQTRPVPKVPHHVELLADFDLGPVHPAPAPVKVHVLHRE